MCTVTLVTERPGHPATGTVDAGDPTAAADGTATASAAAAISATAIANSTAAKRSAASASCQLTLCLHMYSRVNGMRVLV